MINFQIITDKSALAKKVSDLLLAKIVENQNINLGLATGGTMESVYEQFRNSMMNTKLDLSAVTTFNLDEYIGLTKDHPQSYYYYMQHHLFGKLGFDPAKTFLPACDTNDTDAYCQKYSDNIIQRGGLDIQLLGIGTNGHIGFNEPGTAFDSRTHVVELSEQTRIDNSRFFDSLDDVPSRAITLGLKDIFEAKEIVLVAAGPQKADVIGRLAKGEVSERLPASILHKHANATVYLDEQAAALM